MQEKEPYQGWMRSILIYILSKPSAKSHSSFHWSFNFVIVQCSARNCFETFHSFPFNFVSKDNFCPKNSFNSWIYKGVLWLCQMPQTTKAYVNVYMCCYSNVVVFGAISKNPSYDELRIVDLWIVGFWISLFEWNCGFLNWSRRW